MNMDQLFVSLPEALQWEILTDFVGGFAVRKNRLMRFLSDRLKIQILKNTFEINRKRPPSGFLKNFVVHRQQLLMPAWMENEHLYRAEAEIEFSQEGKFAMLFKTISTNQYSRCYYSTQVGSEVQPIITPIDDSVTLPPYEKHDYPSFPYTNRKLGRTEQTMKAFDPVEYRFKTYWGFRTLLPNILELGLVGVAVLGLVFRSHWQRVSDTDHVRFLEVVLVCVLGATGMAAYFERMYMIASYNAYIRSQTQWLWKS
jgi:hypothetical protein